MPKYINNVNDMLPVVLFHDLDINKPLLARVPVDSETATEMMKFNIKNRRVRRSSVNYLKYQIINGEWRDDHPQPIVFSSKGRLIDGQHRLVAISEMEISANEALIVRVETGADDTVREYMDTGIPRSLDDRVEIVDDLQKNKIITQLATFGFYQKNQNYGLRKPSPEYAKDFFVKHEESSLFIANHHKRDKGVGKIQVAYAAMEYYEINKFMAELFYPCLFLPDSPVQQARMLRDYLLRISSTFVNSTNSLNYRNSLYARSINCMKAHLQGRTIKVIRESMWN